MQRLRQWLIEMEHNTTVPLVFQHCDFVEIEQHSSRQQVGDLEMFLVPSVSLHYQMISDDEFCRKILFLPLE